MILRPYQHEALSRIRQAWRDGKRRIILAAPTGSGKTVIGTELVKRAFEKNQHVLWLAHRTELIDQCSERLSALGLVHGIIKAGRRPTAAPIQVASVQTLARRKPPPATLIFVDEAHHARAATWQRLLDQYPDAGIIGLTATPYRLDGQGLGALFDSLQVVSTPAELVKLGFLMEPIVYGADAPDLSGVRKVAGDFSEQGMESVMLRGALVANTVDTWIKRAENQLTIGFATTIKHSILLRDRFLAAGIPTEHLDGTANAAERLDVLGRLRAGKIRVLWNVGILTEGWDLPALAVASLARPTASLGLYLQMVGRIMRPVEGKRPIVLDHAGNWKLHGLPTDEVDFSLEDGVKRERALGSKTCPRCFRVCLPALRACPECGHVFAAKPRKSPTEAPGELRRIIGRSATAEEKRDHWLALEETRIARGYKPGWTSWSFKRRFGHWPRGYLSADESRARTREFFRSRNSV